MWWVLLGAAWAACTAEDLQEHLRAADAAIDDLDTEALTLATEALSTTLACLERPVQVAQAASVHRVRGIQAFVDGDTAAADRWFAASRALDPTAPLGHSIGGPIQAAWDRSSTPIPPDRTELAPPRRGTLFIDGQPLLSHPTHLPWIFQLADGTRVSTALVTAGERAPAYPGDRPPPPPPEERRTRRGKPFTVAALGCVALAGAGLSTAAWSRGRYRDPTVSDAAAADFLVTNRVVGIAGLSFGGIALGLGAAAVIGGEW